MGTLEFNLQAEASLDVLTSDVVKSSAIEGEKLNEDEVRSSIARRLGLDVGGLPKAGRDVEGVVEMMLDATQRFDVPLTKLVAFSIGTRPSFRAERNDTGRITVGEWRTAKSGAMRVVSGRAGAEKVHFEAPAAERLESEMTRFLEWVNEKSLIEPDY